MEEKVFFVGRTVCLVTGDNLETLFDGLADIECTELSDDGIRKKVKVKRDSVEDILNMNWLKRVRTI